MPDISNVKEINNLLASQPLEERLNTIAEQTGNSVFTTSLGREDQMLLWKIFETKVPIRIATLQTGRLFDETMALLNLTQERYALSITVAEPSPEAVKSYIEAYGEDGFYDSLEARHACCHVRKVDPLIELLKDADGWVTGLTREQSNGRSEIPFAEWDHQHKMIKFNPLADVSTAIIDQEIINHEIPVNPLHDQGYPSIGCGPCTKAIKTGEHPRAGRWWWENNDSTECGLHKHAAA